MASRMEQASTYDTRTFLKKKMFNIFQLNQIKLGNLKQRHIEMHAFKKLPCHIKHCRRNPNTSLDRSYM